MQDDAEATLDHVAEIDLPPAPQRHPGPGRDLRKESLQIARLRRGERDGRSGWTRSLSPRRLVCGFPGRRGCDSCVANESGSSCRYRSDLTAMHRSFALQPRKTEDAAERGAFRPGQRSVRGLADQGGAGCRRRLREDYRPTLAKQTLSRELMSLGLRDRAQRFRSIGCCTRASDPKADPTSGIHPMLFFLEQRIVRRADNRVHFSARCASKKTFV